MANIVLHTVHEISIYYRNKTFPILKHTQHDSTQPKAREESFKKEQMVLIYGTYLTNYREQQKVCISAPGTCRVELWNLKIKFQNVSLLLIDY